MATVEQVEKEAAKLVAGFKGAKGASQDSYVEKYNLMCEEHAELPTYLDDGTLTARRGHLKRVKVEIERYQAKVDAGNPAVSRKLAELQAERKYLVGSIRQREDAILARMSEAKG